MNIANLLFGFEGRIRRSEWWITRLILIAGFVLGVIGLGAVGMLTGVSDDPEAIPDGPALIVGLFMILGFAAACWIDAAAGVKRLHDQNLTGLFYLVVFLPMIGGLFALVVFGILDGTRGRNRFGPSGKYPEYRDQALVFD